MSESPQDQGIRRDNKGNIISIDGMTVRAGPANGCMDLIRLREPDAAMGGRFGFLALCTRKVGDKWYDLEPPTDS